MPRNRLTNTKPLPLSLQGMARFSEMAPLRSAANMAFLATILSKHGTAGTGQKHACWAQGQANYILGTSTGRSFVIGVGSYPQRPHHRNVACDAVRVAAPGAARPGWNGTCLPGIGEGQGEFSYSVACCGGCLESVV